MTPRQLPTTAALPANNLSLWQRALRTWDRASVYAPLLLMLLLALGSYWLVRNTPGTSPAAATSQAKEGVDYFMRRFTIKSYGPDGALQSELVGAEGRHFADTDVLEVDEARLRNVNLAGDVTNATGNRAYSNGDGSEIQLVGNAVVVREGRIDRPAAGPPRPVPRLEFQGEFLHVFVNEERVKSHKPVVLIRGSDRFTGDTFEYNHLSGVADLKGRVKGYLVPRAAAAGL